MTKEQAGQIRVPRRRRPNVDASHPVYEIDLWLDGAQPPIWRTLAIRASMTLDQLHWAIQHAMDWDDVHLHQFQTVSGQIYEPVSPQFAVDMIWRQLGFHGPGPTRSTDDTTVRNVFEDLKQGITYLYDFGDSWVHGLRLVNTHDDESAFDHLPICLDGRRAAPPEDSGGIWGYEEKLLILEEANRRSPEYREIVEWMGDEVIDPEAFDLDRINRRLQRTPNRNASLVHVRKRKAVGSSGAKPKRKQRVRRRNKRARGSR